jgi:hypothetical protein
MPPSCRYIAPFLVGLVAADPSFGGLPPELIPQGRAPRSEVLASDGQRVAGISQGAAWWRSTGPIRRVVTDAPAVTLGFGAPGLLVLDARGHLFLVDGSGTRAVLAPAPLRWLATTRDVTFVATRAGRIFQLVGAGTPRLRPVGRVSGMTGLAVGRRGRPTVVLESGDVVELDPSGGGRRFDLTPAGVAVESMEDGVLVPTRYGGLSVVAGREYHLPGPRGFRRVVASARRVFVLLSDGSVLVRLAGRWGDDRVPWYPLSLPGKVRQIAPRAKGVLMQLEFGRLLEWRPRDAAEAERGDAT